MNIPGPPTVSDAGLPPFLRSAVVYDEECFPNAWTLTLSPLGAYLPSTYEISDFRDDRAALFARLQHLRDYQIPMIGFNVLGYDYILLHHLLLNPTATAADLYALSQRIFDSQREDRWGLMVWASDRLIPQIDLYTINHFDNRAKSTSLKALQINMRSETVEDSPVPFGTVLTREQLDVVIDYNRHDVMRTRDFALICMDALRFRIGLVEQFGIDVLNYNDTKIGAKLLEQRLGPDLCYERDPVTGARRPRQTPRQRIALGEIIFPYVRFDHPEFNRVLDYMRTQVLTPADIDDPDAPVQTKGVFKGLSANVGGITFHFGTGGMHGSVERRVYRVGDGRIIRDIDVGGLYPAIGVVNKLAPAHLGARFVEEYAKIPQERKLHAKGTIPNASLKLAANGGGFGMSNNRYSPIYDPQFTMTITINGQLMICMLAEWLVQIPTLELIQCNTDGITYAIDEGWEPRAAWTCRLWEATTGLVLEDADYRAMWIRDVNSYVAEDVKGKLKRKGAYWAPDPNDWAGSIATASPPAWHKDLGNVASINAAVDAMVHGFPVEELLSHCYDGPYDFMCRARCDRSSQLWLGDREMPRTMRYYVGRQGEALTKVSPPVGPDGWFKRANGISEADYMRVMAPTSGQVWSETVCTKIKSRYESRTTAIEQGWPVVECNRADRFDWANLNMDYYIEQARRLVIEEA